MANGPLTSRNYYRLCSLILFLLASAASFNEYYQRTHFNEAHLPGAWSHATFEGMVDGTAYRPYVYRQLLPDLANSIDHHAPNSLRNYLYRREMNATASYLSALTTSTAAWNPTYFLRYAALYLLTYFSAFVAVCAMYWLCRSLALSAPAATFTAVVVILMVPYVMSGGGYFYDFPELAFLSLAVLMAIRYPWWWMIPMVILATWNKESFLLFIPTLYPFLRQKSSTMRALTHTAALLAASAIVVEWLRLRFASNPGSTVVYWFPAQLERLFHLRAMLIGNREAYGIPMLMAYSIGPALLMAWSVWRAWKHIPKPFQRHAQIAALINVPMYLLFVQPGKLRDMSMLYPTLLVVLAVNIQLWFDDVVPAVRKYRDSGTKTAVEVEEPDPTFSLR